MKFATRIGIFLLAALLCLPLVACADVEVTGVWENAAYTSDQTFGEGTKTVTVAVTAEEQSLTLTLRTDKETLGDALREHGLIEDDNGLINAIIGFVLIFMLMLVLHIAFPYFLEMVKDVTKF